MTAVVLSAALRPKSSYRSNLTVLLPLILAGAAAALLSMYVLFVAARQSDSIIREQQQVLVAKVLAKQAPEMVRNQKSVAVWDDAIEKTKDSFDPDWLDANLGVWMHDFFGIDEVFVLTDRNTPVYAMVDGKRAEVSAYGAVASVVTPLATALRATAPYAEPEGDDAPHSGGLTRIGGRPALVSVMPIVSDTGKVKQEPGSEYLHVVIRFLDGSFLADTLRDYSVQNPSFTWQIDNNWSGAAAPLLGRDGSVFGYAAWQPYRPGWALLTRTAPALLGSILVLCGIIALLAGRLVRSSAEARYLALHDPLSNLANRALFDRTLDNALAARKPDRSVALLYLDLDRFKDVNDTLGHPAGDELIRELAARLTLVAARDGCVARLGGDEFAIVFVAGKLDTDVARVCREVIEAVGRPFDLHGNTAFIGVSIGVATAPQDGESRADLTRKADLALYRAKRQGRNRFMQFEPGWDYSELQRRQIEQDLLRGGATAAFAVSN